MRLLPDCEYVCRECGLTTCREDDPSPAEDERICAGCAEVDGDLMGGGA